MKSEPRQRERRRRTAAGAALVGGWAAHDLVIFACTPEPSIALRLLPGSIVLILAGGVAGWLLGPSRGLYAAATATVGILVLATSVVRTPIFDPGHVGLFKSLLVLLLAGTLVGRLPPSGRLVRTAALGVGLAAGVGGLRLVARGALDSPTLLVEGALSIAAVAAFAMPLRAPLPRFAGAAVLGLCVLWIAAEGVRRSALRHSARPHPRTPPREAARDLPNLLLITLDTVRADRLSVYGYPKRTTPGLERLAANGFALYSQARSTSSWTIPSHGSLFTGLLPSEHGARNTVAAGPGVHRRRDALQTSRLSREVTTLAETLSAAGYATAGIVANAGLSARLGFDRGFAHYDARWGAQLPVRLALLQQLGWHATLGGRPYREAGVVSRLALEWLEARPPGRPFFLFVNFMEAHTPYLPRPPFDRALESSRPRDPFVLTPAARSLAYDREIASLDHELSRFLERLCDLEDCSRTVTVITSDHGEAFDEHGTWGHGGVLFDEVIRVPLLIRGTRPPADLDRPIGGDDVYHLILEQLGMAERDGERPHPRPFAEWYHSPGDFGTGRARDVLAWLDGSRKVIVTSTGKVRIFDLESDPRELDEIAAEPALREAYRTLSKDYWDRRRRVEPAAPISEEQRRALTALGYLD